MNKGIVFLVGLLITGQALAAAPPPSPLPQTVGSNIGYKTVSEALASLKQMKGVEFSNVRGWTIVTDEEHLTVWSFAPKSDPSYPAVVRRMVTSAGSGSKVTMDVLCESNKAACNNLVREFSNMNSRSAGAP
jgi:hypothetical protein